SLRRSLCRFRRKGCPPPDGTDAILDLYTRMYDAFFDECRLIPDGRFFEVGYDALVRDPLGVVGSIYASLALDGFEDLRPLMSAYLDTIAGYRKNRHAEMDEA